MFFIQLDKSLRLDFNLDRSSELKTLLINSSRKITCVTFLQSRRNETEGDFQREEQEEKKLMVTHPPSTYIRQNRSSARIIHANEAYSRRNPNSLRNQDIAIKRSFYITSTIIRHASPNPTHEKFIT